jgi:hypothetical protein
VVPFIGHGVSQRHIVMFAIGAFVKGEDDEHHRWMFSRSAGRLGYERPELTVKEK